MTSINIALDVKNYNEGPCIKVYTDSEILIDDRVKEKGLCNLSFETELVLPGNLTIEHHGKNMKIDTKVGSDGNILDDKGFCIKNVKIDECLLVHELFKFKYITETGAVVKNTNYLGFNGKFIIDIDKGDLYEWYSGWQKSLASTQELFSFDKFRKEIFDGESNHDKVVY